MEKNYETDLSMMEGEAREAVEKIYANNQQFRSGVQNDQSFLDPAYTVFPIFVTDIISQAVNPNYQSDKAFDALCTSIINNGMAFPVLVSKNPLYDPDVEALAREAVAAWKRGEKQVTDNSGTTHSIAQGDKENFIIMDDNEEVQIDTTLCKPRCFSGGQDIVDVRNPLLRSYYKYQTIDGTHRLLAVLYGSPMYANTVHNKKAQEIYKRCHGYIPCTFINDKTEQEVMSATILFNPILDEQELYVLREEE